MRLWRDSMLEKYYDWQGNLESLVMTAELVFSDFDLTSDGEINVLDVVSMVSFALESDYPNDIETLPNRRMLFYTTIFPSPPCHQSIPRPRIHND